MKFVFMVAVIRTSYGIVVIVWIIAPRRKAGGSPIYNAD